MNFEMDKTTFLFLNFSDPTKIYNSKEFIAIAGGVAGFWGGVLGLGSLYILMVILRRCLSSALAQDTEDNCGGGQQ